MSRKNYNGRPSKNFTGGSNPHHGGSRSQSGLPSYSYKPPKQRKQRGGASFGTNVANAIFGPGPKNYTHGPGKRKKKR